VREELLRDDARAAAMETVTGADDGTKRRWRDEAARVGASLISETLQHSTEPSLQGSFLDAVFSRLLGYSSAVSGRRPFTLSEHVTTEVDATEADGTLGWFTRPGTGRTIAVIELKDARTNLDKRQLSRRDRLTPVDQAFLYASKFQGNEWVIVSNFIEIRLYSTRHGQRLYESFGVHELANEARLLEFVALFQPDALIGTSPDARGYLTDLLVERPAVRDRDITDRFYEHYSNERNRMLQHFLEQDVGAEPSAIIGATQKLLDRILFICFAEDTRTLLPHGILHDTAEVAERSRSRSQTKIWDELRELFRDIDEGRTDLTPPVPAYNGGLFAKDDLLDEKLTLSDALAWELVQFSDWDYRHSINVEVLGHIFEQSIADLESLHRLHSLDPDAVEADAMAVADTRRARGIYYTPRWVTEYIAETAVGQVAQELGFDAQRLLHVTVVDPACGSGAFLAQAYRYLLELVEAGIPEALPGEQPTLEQPTLEVALRPSLFLQCLFGIDIMPEAVDIARLSLWLATANPQERLLHLDTVREGNTIAPNWTGSTLGSGGESPLAAGGFDAAIGNPPWGADIDYEIDATLELTHGQFDSYELFVERAIRDLVKPDGLFGFIIPDRILRPEGERLRRWLFDNYQVQELIKLGEGVFPGVFRAAVILIVKKTAPTHEDQVRTLVVFKADRELLENSGSTHLRSLVAERGGPISRSRIVSEDGYNVPLGATDEDLEIMATMGQHAMPWTGGEGLFEPFGRGVELGTDGLVIRCNACFEWQVGPRRRAQARGGGYEPKECDNCGATLQQSDWHEHANIVVDKPARKGNFLDRKLPGSGWRQLFVGEDVSRYELGTPKWIRLGVPNINYKPDSLYEQPKLLIRQTGVGVNVAVDETDAMCLQSVYVYRPKEDVGINPHYLLACLASRAMLFYFHRMTNQVEWQSFPKLVHRTLRRLPLPNPRLETKLGRNLHDAIEHKARQRMGLRPEDAHELDLEIETLVMNAYGLSALQRQRIVRTLRSVQRLRVIREMFPSDELGSEESSTLLA
jgi:type I restriction-modification system DNA methylase subunit